MVKVDRRTWKKNYFVKIKELFAEYKKVVVVEVDNVGSKQLQNIRIELRGEAELLFGKNTLMRRAILATENEDYASILAHVKGNIGFIFTNGDVSAIASLLEERREQAPARVGAIAPMNVVIPKGPTGLDAQKTTFFQALNIQTKIARGSIEIVNDVNLLKTGEKVGPSECALLNMLDISPFTYGAVPTQIYDSGACYSPEVLKITEGDVLGKFFQGVANVASVSLALGRPNKASVPHMIANGYKNVLAVAVATDISFPLAEKAKAFLADPSAFVVAAPVQADAPKEEAAPVEEEEEEEDDEMEGFSLFDD